jgi:pilus assembly protein Flp/PilA
MTAMLRQLWRDEEAPTAVEYGIMVALIAVFIITAVELIGTNLDATFDKVGAKLGG